MDFFLSTVENVPYYALQRLSLKIHMPAITTHLLASNQAINFKTDQQDNIADEKHATSVDSQPRFHLNRDRKRHCLLYLAELILRQSTNSVSTPPDSNFNINADGGIFYNSFDYLIISLREEVTFEKLSEIKNVSGQSF